MVAPVKYAIKAHGKYLSLDRNNWEGWGAIFGPFTVWAWTDDLGEAYLWDDDRGWPWNRDGGPDICKELRKHQPCASIVEITLAGTLDPMKPSDQFVGDV